MDMPKIYRSYTNFIPTFVFLVVFSCSAFAQTDANKLVTAILGETPIEEDLQELCDEIGGRVTGSKANEAAVEWAYQKFKAAGVKVDKVPFEMPALWLEKSTTAEISGGIAMTPQIVSKFYSPAQTHEGILLNAGMGTAEDFTRLGNRAKGAFILVETEICLDINGLFAEYVAASKTEDLARAAGVKGIVFMASRPNKLLYSFVSKKVYDNEMPQLVMAREDARRCLRSLRNGKKLNIKVDIDADTGGAYKAYNVIGEIKGKEKPKEVVIIGAHLDSWALGTGANDNGCNVSMLIDIARQIEKLGIRPKRTIRFALWNGEEQGYFGSWAYTDEQGKKLDKHMMAMSVDIGSGAIFGFFTNGRKELMPALDEVLKPVQVFGPYQHVDAAIVGTDNFDFMMEGVPNLVANHLAANYGTTYHSASDTYDKVDLKSLKINSAIIASVTLGFANLPDDKINWKRHNHEQIEALVEEQSLEFSMRMFNVWKDWEAGKRGRH